MVAIDLSDGLLRVRLTGWDRLWALKWDLAVPLAHVTAVRIDPETARPRRVAAAGDVPAVGDHRRELLAPRPVELPVRP